MIKKVIPILILTCLSLPIGKEISLHYHFDAGPLPISSDIYLKGNQLTHVKEGYKDSDDFKNGCRIATMDKRSLDSLRNLLPSTKVVLDQDSSDSDLICEGSEWIEYKLNSRVHRIHKPCKIIWGKSDNVTSEFIDRISDSLSKYVQKNGVPCDTTRKRK